jgi:hypothetical protein
MVRAERRRHGGEVDDILVQGWLVALDLNDQADAGLLGDVEDGVDGPNGISVPE